MKLFLTLLIVAAALTVEAQRYSPLLLYPMDEITWTRSQHVPTLLIYTSDIKVTHKNLPGYYFQESRPVPIYVTQPKPLRLQQPVPEALAPIPEVKVDVEEACKLVGDYISKNLPQAKAKQRKR
jgi:hypothetical protein